MSEHFVTPDRQVAFGGRTFTLKGTFAVLRDMQHAFKQDLILLQSRVIDMRQDEIARLIAIAGGGNEEEIGQLVVDELDVTGTDYLMLKAELLAWLAVAMTPKRDREKKAQAMAELIERLRTSRGVSGGSSPSASSAGRRKRSGKVPSGT